RAREAREPVGGEGNAFLSCRRAANGLFTVIPGLTVAT
ncbi:hypothetical protein CSUI_004264, partial [Cystoisospora suis]